MYVDTPAAPTYADESQPKKRAAAVDKMTEQQLAYARHMGMAVPVDMEPDGSRFGDSFWTAADCDESAVMMSGMMHSVRWILIVPATVASKAVWAHELVDAVRPVHEQLSKWNEDSALSRLNKRQLSRAGAGPPLPPLLEEALQLCDAVNAASEGLFDPSVGPLAAAWSDSLANAGAAPDSRLVQDLLASKVGWQKQHTQNIQIDLDCVSKGFGVDFAAKRLASLTGSFYFDWGGEAVCAGKHPSGRQWRTCILRAPSLQQLFMGWRTQSAVEVSAAVAAVDLPVSGAAWATSGDYGQGKRFGYFHIANPKTGMLMQASGSSVASVTVRGKSCATCDALATAAMVFGTPQQAHAWLHGVAKQFGVAEFYVVSRGSPLLTHSQPPATAVNLFEVPVRGGFSLSAATMLAVAERQRQVTLSLGSGVEMAVPTARVASLSPLLVSLLVPESFSAKQFQVEGLQCRVMHKSGSLVLASASDTLNRRAADARRVLESTFVASITRLDTGAVLEKCSSLAVAEGAVSFNVEQHSQFGVAIADAQAGLPLSIAMPDEAVRMEVVVRDVVACGDHVLVVCGVLHD